MERIPFGKHTVNAQRPRVDRFVTPREAYPEIQRRMLWAKGFNQIKTDALCIRQYQKQTKYINYLDEALGLEPLQECLEGSKYHNKRKNFWPCIPRKKTFLSSAESILDLPYYRNAPFPDLLDWSNDNILVAALGRTYYKWCWQTQRRISFGHTNLDVLCCKFDPRDQYLLFGTGLALEVHDHLRNKLIYSIACRCDLIIKNCSISAVDWSPTGNAFVMGCTQGLLTSWTRRFQYITSRLVDRGVIRLVKVSPDARFVAASTLNGKVVFLFTWPLLEKYSTLCSDSTIKSFTWHPWRSALLGVGSTSPSLGARVALWDVPSSSGIREFDLGKAPFCLDSMLFSHQTGELVLSLWYTGDASRPRLQLLVMSDPSTMVDHCTEHEADMYRIRTMVFSPDGTKLATATAGEDLVIWNFISDKENPKKKKKSRKIYYSFPVRLDEVTYGYSLR